jgi:hypothetical protein
VNKVWVTALMVMALALAPGPPASAQSAVEYGGVASQNQGGAKLGSAVNQKIGSWKTRARSPKQSKAKG